MLFETMHKVIQKRQGIDDSMNHALSRQMEEYSLHLHDSIEKESISVVVDAHPLEKHTLDALDGAVRDAKDKLDTLPAVIARLERARTVIMDEEERRKHGNPQGNEINKSSTKQRRISKQFDLANKLSLY